jgi:hypothetical protein
VVQQFPICPEWKSLAKDFAIAQFDKLTPKQQQRISSESTEPDDLPDLQVAHYADQTFRQDFYRVIGHQYVLAILRSFNKTKKNAAKSDNSKNSKKMTINNDEWASKLGVDRSTVHRWKTQQSMASAEIFFAVQLLVMNRPFKKLTLPDNDEMLKLVVLHMMSEIRKTLNSGNPSVLTERVFRAVYVSMSVMKVADGSLYLGQGVKQPAENDNALKLLTNHLRQQIPADYQTLLPSELRKWLDDWGLPYSVLATSYQIDWKGARFQS